MYNNLELGVTLTEIKIKRYPSEKITHYTNYADDIDVTSNTLKDDNTLLLKIESAAKEIGRCINTEKTEYIQYQSEYKNSN